jgi:16S rRNA (cytosine1402-N4)-methyltransferase
MEKHTSVLLNESIEGLNLNEGSIVVDCTLGYGGHSSTILNRILRGYLLAFDQDEDAVESSLGRLSQIGTNFEIIKSNFKNIKEELEKRNIKEVDAILYDLGVSSPQLDEASRGFSFHQNAELDMRMDKDSPISAYTVINTYDEDRLAKIIFEYGEEKFSRSIARNIVKARGEHDIKTTDELV